MSQDTFSIANQSRTAYRGSVNTSLQALASNNSGASAPGTPYAYMWWSDTASGLIKQRNAANTGWLVRGTIAETFGLARSSNTILGIADYARLFIATGSFTQTLTAVATLGDGWHCHYRNDGTGVITLDPNASETIDGATTLKLYPGESCMLFCDGTQFKTIGLQKASVVLIPLVRANDAASGNVSYTGAGFKPRAISFTGAINGTRIATINGYCAGAVNTCVYDSQAVAGSYGTSAIACLIFDEVTGSKSQGASLASFDDDGFTLTWTRTGATSSGNIDIQALCER